MRSIPTSPQPSRFAALRRFALPAGMAIAAGIAGLYLRPVHDAAPVMRSIAAPADAARSIVLADGTRIELARGSAIRFDPARPRAIVLGRGRAMFDVHHDDSVPFSVTVGGRKIVDVGTIFEVSSRRDSADVAVIEGRIALDPMRGGPLLAPGNVAQWQGDGAVAVSRIPVVAIGQWRRDRMTYDDVPLARAIGDLAAALGHPIAIPPALTRRRFSGTLIPATLRDRPDELDALLDLRVRRDGQGWALQDS